MITIVRTNDIVLISLIEGLLAEHGIPVFVADRHVSAMEGSIGAFPCRIMVPEDRQFQARRFLREAALAMNSFRKRRNDRLGHGRGGVACRTASSPAGSP